MGKDTHLVWPGRHNRRCGCERHSDCVTSSIATECGKDAFVTSGMLISGMAAKPSVDPATLGVV